MSSELQCLAPLLLEEATQVECSGDRRQYLPLLAEPSQPRKWNKKNAPVVGPGESDTEIFIFFLPKEKAVDLKALVAYSFIYEQQGKKPRVWQVASCHNIEPA